MSRRTSARASGRPARAGSYAFNIRDDALQGASVGRVYIPGRLADTVSYVIAGGNEDGAFAIDSSSGRISVASALDASAVDAYSLTVAASDGIGDRYGWRSGSIQHPRRRRVPAESPYPIRRRIPGW